MTSAGPVQTTLHTSSNFNKALDGLSIGDVLPFDFTQMNDLPALQKSRLTDQKHRLTMVGETPMGQEGSFFRFYADGPLSLEFTVGKHGDDILKSDYTLAIDLDDQLMKGLTTDYIHDLECCESITLSNGNVYDRVKIGDEIIPLSNFSEYVHSSDNGLVVSLREITIIQFGRLVPCKKDCQKDCQKDNDQRNSDEQNSEASPVNIDDPDQEFIVEYLSIGYINESGKTKVFSRLEYPIEMNASDNS